jgi:hypothetical protein
MSLTPLWSSRYHTFWDAGIICIFLHSKESNERADLVSKGKSVWSLVSEIEQSKPTNDGDGDEPVKKGVLFSSFIIYLTNCHDFMRQLSIIYSAKEYTFFRETCG